MRATPGTMLASALLLALLPAEPAFAAGALKLIPSLDLLAINFVVLLVLIPFVNRLLLQPLVAVLEEREARTTGALERSEVLGREALETREQIDERLLAAGHEAQQRRAGIVAEANSEERRILGDSREAANSEIEDMRRAVAAELESSRDGLRRDAESLAREAASRILGRNL